jgi:hypothetical protein
VLTLAGSAQTTYIFMGDAWDSKGDAGSNYMWQPMSVSASAHTATLQDYAYWKVNTATGAVMTSSTGKRYEAEDARIQGRAGMAARPLTAVHEAHALLQLSWTARSARPSARSTTVSGAHYSRGTHGTDVSTVDRTSNVTFTDVEGLGTGERQWVSLHYTVNNATGTHARQTAHPPLPLTARHSRRRVRAHQRREALRRRA